MMRRRRRGSGEARRTHARWTVAAPIALAIALTSGASRASEDKAPLVVIGSVTFGLSYLVSLPLAFADPGEPGAARAIPVVGPIWGAACAFGASCGGVGGHPAVGVGEAVVAAGQLAGLTLLTVGLVTRSSSTDVAGAPAMTVTPTQQGATVAWSGRF